MKKKILTYLKELSKFKADNNCQSFAAALELKFRGQNVIVRTIPTPLDKVFDLPPGYKYPVANWCLFKHVEFDEFPSRDPIGFIQRVMRSYGNNARAFISITWKEGIGGHVFNLINVGDEPYAVDAQQKKIWKLSDCPYIKDIDSEKSQGIIRTDNQSINPFLLQNTFSPPKADYSLERINNKRLIPENETFTSILHGLNQYGEKNVEFRVYYRHKAIGRLICEDIEHDYNFPSDNVRWIVWKYAWI